MNKDLSPDIETKVNEFQLPKMDDNKWLSDKRLAAKFWSESQFPVLIENISLTPEIDRLPEGIEVTKIEIPISSLSDEQKDRLGIVTDDPETSLNYVPMGTVEISETHNANYAEGKNGFKKGILTAAVTGMMLVGALAGCNGSGNQENQKAAEEQESPENTLKKTKEDIMKQTLINAGWPEDSFTILSSNTIGDFRPDVDPSSAGEGRFAPGDINYPEEMIEFLSSDSRSSEAVLNFIANETGATREEIIDVENWLSIQSWIPFTYPENTAFVYGEVKTADKRSGEAGEIFLAYVNITDDKVIILVMRGVCGNPQIGIPVPGGGLEAKDASQDPAARGNAPQGGGPNQNPGPGEYDPNPTQPSEENRVDPEPPAPTPPKDPGIIYDPTPAPPPERGAPTPSNPAEGEAPVEGGSSV